MCRYSWIVFFCFEKKFLGELSFRFIRVRTVLTFLFFAEN